MTRAPSFAARGRTLRTFIDERRALGTVFTLNEAVGIIVPLAVELAQRSTARASVSTSTRPRIISDGSGGFTWTPRCRDAPAGPNDTACLAPEERGGNPGDARSSVFAIGTMLYELCTGQLVGPGMRRPTEVVPALAGGSGPGAGQGARRGSRAPAR